MHIFSRPMSKEITFYQHGGVTMKNKRKNETIRNRNVRASVLSIRGSALFHSLSLQCEWVQKKLYTFVQDTPLWHGQTVYIQISWHIHAV
jgi:hypothetical protein